MLTVCSRRPARPPGSLCLPNKRTGMENRCSPPSLSGICLTPIRIAWWSGNHESKPSYLPQRAVQPESTLPSGVPGKRSPLSANPPQTKTLTGMKPGAEFPTCAPGWSHHCLPALAKTGGHGPEPCLSLTQVNPQLPLARGHPALARGG